ncbi:MAG TPA: protein translocase subunit SecD, partial [Ignavibacteriaceae bacterium]
MKEFRLRIILILVAVVFSLYLLYPTYLDQQNSKEINQVLETRRAEMDSTQPELSSAEVDRLIDLTEDSLLNANPDIVKNREKRIKLGLDLRGGMRVVLEVNTGKLLEKIAKNPDETFKTALHEAEEESNQTDESVVDILSRKLTEKGIRLSRYFGTIRQDDAEIISELQTDAEDAVTRAIEIIRNRVDQYGVSEPSIQRQGGRRIIVELPGVSREEEAKRLLQGTALLEFRIVRDPDFTFAIMKKIDEVLAGKVDITKDVSEISDSDTLSTDTTSTAPDTSNQELSEEEFRQQHPFFSIAVIDPQGNSADAYVKADERSKLQYLLNRSEVQNVIPNNVEFVFHNKPIGS